MLTPLLDQISQAKKVLLLGYGREGQSTHKFLSQRFPHLTIAIADQQNGANYLDSIANYQVIIKSPGVSPHSSQLIEARRARKLITSQTQIFFELCLGKIIGVTGTKGKSTTASLIHHVLDQNRLPTILVGNIGLPMLDYLPQITSKTWVVAELSSYQLMDMGKSPHIAVVQNIFPDHLDYHQSYKEYWQAKASITKFQTAKDCLIFNADNTIAKRIAAISKAKVIPFTQLKPLLKLSNTQLLGQHNIYNATPAIIIGQLLKIPKPKIMIAIKSFSMLENRLQLVATHNGAKFYADTLATIPEATIAALETLGSDVVTLIAGGHERHQRYAQLAKSISNSHIKTVILFPQTGIRLKKEIVSPKIKRFLVSSMESAVKLAIKNTPAQKICLLSPAAPSFTLFKDHKDETHQYKKWIELSKVGIS